MLGTTMFLPGMAMAQQAPPALPRLADFPTRPVELVVAFPAGGGMDVTARIIARHAERLTGQRFFVNNRTGGAGMVAHAYLARQAPSDGYTVGIVSSGLFADSMLRARGLWSYADVELAAFINFDATNWIVSARGPLAGLSLAQIISRASENPESIRVSMLPESSSQFIIEQVERSSGARFIKVPFQGGIPGMTAMLGGHIDIATVFFSEYRSQLEAGAVRAVGVAGPERTANQLEVPTFNEVLGTQDVIWAAWRFAVVPKAVPADRREY
ncbi:MAG: tripartite tricarboxylate transporter substrate binding protein, partial [Rhodospirillales bacterium]|nr:tripartite tricarboxylate transporter substrate binding protein [Rhodospirillales bacterium]